MEAIIPPAMSAIKMCCVSFPVKGLLDKIKGNNSKESLTCMSNKPSGIF